MNSNNKADTVVTKAEKIRKEIENHEFMGVGKITASFGFTHFLGDENKDTMIKRVDRVLYRAKENGRNCVEALL